MTLHFNLPGPPRTKKNHNRLVRAGGRYRVLPSKPYEEWRRSLEGYALHLMMSLRRHGVRLPITRPVRVAATFYRDRNIGDLVGYQQALADWMEGVGLLENDRQIVSWDGTRMDVDRERPRIEVEIETAE